MADEATAQATEETQAAPAEETAADSATDNQTEEQTPQTPEADASQGEADAKSNDSSGDKEQSPQDSKPEKPLSRRSAAFRIQQLTRENKALKEQSQPKPEQQDEWETPQTDGPDINKIVNEAVQAALNPVISESSKTADDSEINEVFSGQNAADRPKYESRIRSLWNLPQYKDVAASDLLNMLRGGEMAQTIERAKQEAIEEHKKAEKEAKESSAGGTSNSNRTGKSGKSVNDMTDEEFRQHNERVKAGQALIAEAKK